MDWSTNKGKTASAKDDYYKDDILYCGKCDTPKEVILSGRKVSCDCDCEHARYEAEQKEWEAKQKQIRIDQIKSVAYMDRKTQEHTFENDKHLNPRLEGIAHNFVSNWEEIKSIGKGLLFYGNPGTGKSFYAACIVNELIGQGVPCLFTSLRDIINAIKGINENSTDFLNRINQADLLVIDDFGAERDTKYMNEKVFDVIDSRFRTGKPTIITTNLTANELKNEQNIERQRIYSRLWEMCEPIHVKGDDQRKLMLKENDRMREMLGIKTNK